MFIARTKGKNVRKIEEWSEENKFNTLSYFFQLSRVAIMNERFSSDVDLRGGNADLSPFKKYVEKE